MKIKYLLYILIPALLIMSCTEEPEFEASLEGYAYISAQTLNTDGELEEDLTYTVTEGCGDSLYFEVVIPFNGGSGSATIEFGGDATIGTTDASDVVVVGGTLSGSTLTLSLSEDDTQANIRTFGSFVLVFPDDDTADGNKSVTMTLSSASHSTLASVKAGSYTGQGKTGSVSVNDVASIDWSGTYTGTSTITGGDCAPTSYSFSVVIALTSGTTYSISDISFGEYDGCYNADDNPGSIDIDAAGNVSFTDVPDVVFGGDDFDGTGSIDPCSFELSVTWSNNYGDAGTSVGSL